MVFDIARAREREVLGSVDLDADRRLVDADEPVSLLLQAATPVAAARLKPTVTITLYFWSMNDWMDGP